MKRTRLLAVFATGLLPLSLVLTANAGPVPATVAGTGAAPAVGAADDAVVAAAARAHGLRAADLTVLTRTRTELPITGVSLTRAKVLDRASGQVVGVAIDSSGDALSYLAARRAETAAHFARFGTMTRQLARVVDSAAANERVAVSFWLKADHNSVVTRDAIESGVTARLVARVEAGNLARMADAVRPVNRDFAASLKSRDLRVISAARYSPAVFAVVPARAVARLSRDARVQATYFAGARAENTQNIAKTTTAATKVWAKGITGADPFTGSGANTGVVECCDSLFEENKADFDAENNYYLARISEGRAAACAGDHSHPTAVSGIIGSTHPQITGIANNANIYFNSAASCGGNEAELVTASQNVSANVSGATNHSYRFFTGGAAPCPSVTVAATLARALDDLVRGAADSQYVAAGNDGNTACVGSPATAWNIVSVGAFDDKNSLAWTGDTMAGFSSGADPAGNSGDREEPDLAGPGVNFTGLLPSPGAGPTGNIGSGTSYAAPVMTGGAALAQQLRPFLLSWPETEKAVLMASSCHNIEGGQAISELDGSGGPDFLEMYNLLNLNRFRGDSIPNGSGVAVTQTFPGVASGQDIRVALAWDTNTSYSLYATDPSDDLDLTLKRPNGTIAATSSSFDNTNEVIEFRADAAGTWTIEVNRFRTSDPAGSTFAGLAWHRTAPAACTAP